MRLQKSAHYGALWISIALVIGYTRLGHCDPQTTTSSTSTQDHPTATASTKSNYTTAQALLIDKSRPAWKLQDTGAGLAPVANFHYGNSPGPGLIVMSNDALKAPQGSLAIRPIGVSQNLISQAQRPATPDLPNNDALIQIFYGKLQDPTHLPMTHPIAEGKDELTAKLATFVSPQNGDAFIRDFIDKLNGFIVANNLYATYATLFLPSDVPLDKSPVLSEDTKELLKADPNPQGEDRTFLNRYLLRDFYLYYYGQELPLPDLNEIRDVLRTNAPPEALLYTDLTTIVEHERVLYAPVLSYSDGPRGFDLGIRPYFGEFHGLGGTLHLDLGAASRRFAHSLSNYQHDVQMTQGASKAQELYENLKNAYTRTVLGWNAAAVFDYTSLNHIGTVKDAGISISKVLCHHEGWSAFSVLLSAQGVQFSPEGLSSRSAVRTGAALIWQDRISYFEAPGEAEIQRWQWQLGFENDFQNIVDGGNSWNVFVRYRRKKTNYDVSLIYGKQPDHSDYVGLQTSWNFVL